MAEHEGRSGRRPSMPSRLAPAAALVVGGCALGYVLAGAGGVLLTITFGVVVGLLVAAAAAPSAPRPTSRGRRRWRWRAGHGAGTTGYRSYERVERDLSWGAVSPRHFDTVTRPLLQRIAAVRLAERHGIDLTAQPAAARGVVGGDLWRYLDPGRPAERSSQPPGIGHATLARVVERLEQL